MTRRDMRWRAAGLALYVGGCAMGAMHPGGSPLTLLYFFAALFGIVLMLNGKRVWVVWEAERRGHQDTATVIHSQRLRGQRASAQAEADIGGR